jgi:vacuolar-type H+-ATPase subunit I/STV1
LDKESERAKAKTILAHYFGKDCATWEDAHKFFRDKNQNSINNLDQVINSHWTQGDKKSYLIIFKSILILHGISQDMIVDILESIDHLENAVSLLNQQVEKSQNKSKELEDALSKVNNTFAEPRIAKVATIMEQIEKQIEDAKKASKAYDV